MNAVHFSKADRSLFLGSTLSTVITGALFCFYAGKQQTMLSWRMQQKLACQEGLQKGKIPLQFLLQDLHKHLNNSKQKVANLKKKYSGEMPQRP